MGGHTMGGPDRPRIIPLELNTEAGVPRPKQSPNPMLGEMAQGRAPPGRLGRGRPEEATGLLPQPPVGLDREGDEAGGEERDFRPCVPQGAYPVQSEPCEKS